MRGRHPLVPYLHDRQIVSVNWTFSKEDLITRFVAFITVVQLVRDLSPGYRTRVGSYRLWGLPRPVHWAEKTDHG
jgi:hypothetical protein